MSCLPRLRLFVDAEGKQPFGGSCSAVSYMLGALYGARGGEHEETLVRPQRLLRGILQPAEHVQVTPAEGGVDLFFEEVFLRAEHERPADRKNAYVFFNLMCFHEENVESYGGIRSLLFNSAFLRRVFLAHVWDPRFVERAGLFRSTQLLDCTLALPLSYFPEGYSSVGTVLADSELERLRQSHLLGHALRPGLDPVAAVAIAHGLRERLSRARSPRLLVLRSQWDALQQAADALAVPAPVELFERMPRLEHRSLLRLMAASDFGLAYDQSVEAFGFYALESVHSGTPLYTNGAGNLRHVLPEGHGIVRHEQMDMAFGDAAQVRGAYGRVAEQILDDLETGRRLPECQRGRRWSLSHYGRDAFEQRVWAALGEPTAPPQPPMRASAEHLALHPLVRTLDLASGRVITDVAALQLDTPMRDRVASILQGRNSPHDQVLVNLLAHQVVCGVHPDSPTPPLPTLPAA